MLTPESPLSAAPTAPSSPSRCTDFKLDEEIDYFDEARKARLEIEEEDQERDLEDDGPPIVAAIFQSSGDVHFCRGNCCPLLQLEPDGSYTCPISGLSCGVKSVREDTSTGRMTGSSNPDDTAGGQTFGPRVDAFDLSVKAFEAAESNNGVVDESTIFIAAKKTRKRKGEAEPKRGARCVDQEKDEHVAKATRRSAETTEQHDLLLREAEVVLSNLLTYQKREDVEDKKMDPKLADREALFQAASQKYMKAQQSQGALPCLSDLHDLAIAAARVAAAHRKKQEADRERSGRQALLLKPSIKSKLMSLCVTLWLAACDTRYMKEEARNTESFRPFISGVLYALKRGVQLATGESVVPACPELCEALPELRGTQANSAAKSLHAASHSGLRTLHRSIASCSEAHAVEHFGTCILQAKAIADDVKRRHFDI